MVEQRAVDHRREGALPHAADYLVEVDRRTDLDVKRFQVAWVRAIGVFDEGRIGPGRRRIPAVADHADAADLLTDRLEGLQHPLHGPPAEPIIAHIVHPILLGTEVQRHLPRRVVSVEEEGAHVRPQRVERRLVDLVRKTVADVGPPPARRTVRVIIVANNTDRVVVFAVTVDNHSSLPGYLPNQAHEIEVVASLDLRRPFKNEDNCIVRPDVERITERRSPVRRTIHHDFMAQRLSNLSVVVEILSASTIFVHVVDEYQTHKRGGLLTLITGLILPGRSQLMRVQGTFILPIISSQLFTISISSRSRATCECFSASCCLIPITMSA